MGAFFSTISEWISELISGMMSATPQGFVGVGLIFIYFVIILASAAMRIRRGEHLSHH